MVEFENTDEFGVANLEVLAPPSFKQMNAALCQDEGVILSCANGKEFAFVPKVEQRQTNADRLYTGKCYEGNLNGEPKPIDAKLHLQLVSADEYFAELALFLAGLH